MSNPALGHVTCPHCGNASATVHRESRGRAKKLYYRCYSGGECGTIQCRGPGGQRWINEHVRWFDGEDQDKAASEAGEEAKAAAEEAIRGERRESARGKGLMGLLWSNENE